MEIYFITTNDLKFAELADAIPGLKQLKIELNEIQSLDIYKIIKFKIQQAVDHLPGLDNQCVLVDDTSVFLEAFDFKLPGPFIRFFVSTLGCQKLYDLCSSIGRFGARAVTTLGFYNPKTGLEYFTGEVVGRIVKPNLDSYSNWDPIFCPAGESKSFYDLGPEGKAKHSMRRKAVDQLLAKLKCC